MPRTKTKKPSKPKSPAKAEESKAFQLRKAEKEDPHVHQLGRGIICDTDTRGYETPRALSPTRIVVDASEGFVPLWAKNSTLRWRFREQSMTFFANPTSAKNEIRKLLGEAILDWGDAAPVKFSEKTDAWDFEIVVRKADDCDINGCVLASAFFPDAGRHKLEIYPQMFSQSREEQVQTLIHEIGHVFGLRHFFANVSETEWASEIFGKHSKFTIMNYGVLSRLTPDDRKDLRRLYKLAWTGELTEVNGTPIRFVKPFHMSGVAPESFVAVSQINPAFQPQQPAG